MDWLTSDLPTWLGILLPLLVGGGSFAHGQGAALARARLDDRRELLVRVLELREVFVREWTWEDVRGLIGIARRLPHTERVMIIELVDEWDRASAAPTLSGRQIVLSDRGPQPATVDEIDLIESTAEESARHYAMYRYPADSLVRYLEQRINPTLVSRLSTFLRRVVCRWSRKRGSLRWLQQFETEERVRARMGADWQELVWLADPEGMSQPAKLSPEVRDQLESFL